MDKKKVARTLIGGVVVAALGVAGYYGYEDYYYVKTEDATVTGDIYKVASTIPGKIARETFEEGSQVKADDILFEQEQTNVSSVDNAFVRSPITGVVLQKIAKPGEVVAAGSTLATVVSKKDLYIKANIEETNASQIKIGQPVDIEIDMYPGSVFHGKVKEIMEATQSAFSLLPPMNTGGNFTKVTQRVPVKIAFTDGPYDFKPGLNAVVKIHVR
ncbi:CusB/HlyD membrane fusion family barrel-sandwich protein [Aneurinibacillus soli]|uniref:Putative multidrug resistance protein EmrK n=1 Tax=Aneurinibacillus soli TaxID=1500254 RepID=A0A0U5BB24_9BACL|nr:efflux RND transporter periplasmic adaptor subunit [Aneurinibacillus soli]PYE63104.1 CusB/HlyD membrane fusion family barrel-sandwich protein [Aneurinibacillus soli]BAU28838.1 putative multidrug resistance protein EmrK [Aneurinibacillus soli]